MSLGLVNYSSTSDEDEDAQQNTIKTEVPKTKSSKLPNPFQKDKTVQESSTDHNGKVRTFEHERGIWASYIYINCPTTESIQTMQSEMMDQISAITDDESIDVHLMEELHMSLTRTSILRHHWIDEFIRSVQNSLQNIPKFSIPLNSIRIYCNDNRTRTFISLKLNELIESSVQNNLCNIVKRLDRCLSEFNLPPFYQEASFHVSIMWCLGDRRDLLEPLLPQFEQILERLITSEPSEFILNVEQLNAKIGNKLFNFRL